jgi:hypothetical protein
MPLVRLLLLLSLAACSASGPADARPDAPAGGGDAGGDGQEPPETGIVELVVSGYPGVNMPPQYFADVSVVVYKPDGSVATTVKTDAMGRASAMIERNSLVAVVNPMNYVHVHAAIANPGDTLRFGPDLFSREPNGSVSVSWPARVITGYTTYYYVYTSCGYSGETTSTSITLPLYKGCSTAPFDVVVTSRRSSQEVTGVMSRRAIQATGGLVTVNLGDNGGVWQVASTRSVALANTPAATTSTACSGVQYLGDLSFNATGTYTSSTTCSMRLLPEPQSTWAVEASFRRNDEDRFAVQMRETFPQTALGAIDVSNHLPWITGLAYDPATRRVTWSSEGDAQLDASALRIDVTQGRYLVWRIFAANGLPKTFTIPELPAEHAMWDLRPTDVARASLVNIDYVGVTPTEVMARNLNDEDSFNDRVRRGATARTP